MVASCEVVRDQAAVEEPTTAESPSVSPSEPEPTETSPSPTPSGEPAVLLAAGDIAECGDEGDDLTAKLVEGLEGTIVTLGDNAYDDGTPEQFAECYAPTWGKFKDRTLPALGNHDYLTEDAEGYFEYFGDRAGDPTKGYYSVDVGDWHLVILNSNCSEVGGCGTDSPQVEWLRQDLEASEARCTAAVWHHPRFSSGHHGSDEDYIAFWQALYDAGAEIVMNGHDHNYERFAPQSPLGAPDPDHGITQFVVGTGGKGLRDMEAMEANTVVHDTENWGVLELTLHATRADFRFVPVEGGTFTDSGSIECHDGPRALDE